MSILAVAIERSPSGLGEVSPWTDFMSRLLGVRSLSGGGAALRALKGDRSRRSIFRVSRAHERCWVVVRPGARMEHSFATLDEAIAFIRHEATAPATVELRIGELYMVGFYDPNRPCSLFGERL